MKKYICSLRFKLRFMILLILVISVLLIFFQARKIYSNGIETDAGFRHSRHPQDKDTVAVSSSFDSTGNTNCTPIQIAIVCVGSDSSREVVTLIKSLLFYRTRPIHIHFIVNDMSKIILSHLFRTWDIPDFTVSFYLLDRYVGKISWIPNTHYSGIYGLVKIIISEILPLHISKVIVLDTDMLFKGDIFDLWKMFHAFSKSNAIGLVENQSDWYLGTLWKKYKPWPALGRGYNTGVMLLDCDKLRLNEWNSKWESVTKAVLPVMLTCNLADQDIMNAVSKEYPDLVHALPCNWNLQLGDNMKPELCYSRHKHEINVIHWNTRKKYKLQHAYVKTLNYFHQNFVEMNAALLRLPVAHCISKVNNDEQFTGNDIDNSNDACIDFEMSDANLHRTHLYYLPFEYTYKKNDVSVVVQLSVDRFAMFEKLCQYWDGPVSVAVFISDADTERLINLIKLSQVLSVRKNIAYHFVFQNSKEEIYPINLLRNIALHHAFTDYIFLYDVDFVPMPGLHDYIRTHLSEEPESCMTALIVPAFESLWYKFAMPVTKAELLKQIDNGIVTSFRSYMWPQGHAATNYSQWKTARKPYSIKWQPEFEPYVIVSKAKCPKYDDRFIGFGWNKVSHIIELDAAGFSFVVLPFGFMIHLPHSPSIDLLKYRSISSYRDCVQLAKLNFLDYLTRKYGNNSMKYINLYQNEEL